MKTRDIEGNVIPNNYEILNINETEKAIHVKGNSDGAVTLSQKLNISGTKGDIYHVSFLYKAEGILESDGFFGNLVNLQFTSTEEGGVGTQNLPLNTNVDGWQYFCGSFVAEHDYENFYLNFISGREPNGFIITNVLIIKDLSQIYYRYDQEGNVIGIQDLTNETNKMAYDKNNQLISSFSPNGGNYKYEYDNEVKTRLLKSVSPTGISNEINYDTFGNPIKTRIQNKNNAIEKDKLYHIRLKGTNKYMVYDCEKKEFCSKEDQCNYPMFELEQLGEYFKIKLNDSYLFIDQKLVLTKNNHTLFKIEELSNGSYFISPKGSNKCLAYENNRFQLKEVDWTPVNLELEDSCEFYFEDTNPLFIEGKAEYKEDGSFLKSTTDALGKTTTYDIDENTGLTKSITDPKGKITNYEYNQKEQITKVKKENLEVSYEYNSQDLLKKIKCNNKEYTFDYDNFLNSKEIKINNNTLVTNEYAPHNGNLLKIKYGNNKEISYTYDNLNRVKKLQKENNSYNYQYNNLNKLASIDTNKESYKYFYDYANRIKKYEYKENSTLKSIEYTYDNNSNVLEKNYNNQEKLIYNYQEDDTVINMAFDNYSLNILYDELGRLKEKNINGKNPITYKYLGNGNKTSMMIKERKEQNNSYEYLYDDDYNITHIYKNKELEHKYLYDELNELVEDQNYKNHRTYVYTYDTSGNIIKKQEYDLEKELLIKEDNYSYNNVNWKDELTNFNKDYITYDEIGNPISIGNTSLTYQNGRELKSYKKKDLEVSYEYNKDGIRTKKIVNGIPTNYFTENSTIIFEEKENSMLYYIRDDKGYLLGFKKDGETYFYQKNIQEDITGIYNKDFELLATYDYDAWGRVVSIKNQNNEEITEKSHIAYLNPFRYRSYYYDEETSLYYLNSRYYNPEWGRFLNADGIIGTDETTIGYNLYAYCDNTPVNGRDSEGNITLAMIGAGIAAIGSIIVGGILSTPHARNATRKVTRATVNAMASGARAVVNTAIDTATKVKDLFKPLPTKGEWSVYELIDYSDLENPQVEYVGRTKNLERRKHQHENNLYKADLEMKIIERDIPYARARGIEQALIMKHRTLKPGNYRNNQINGISFNNKFRLDYIAAASDYFGEETYVGGIKW